MLALLVHIHDFHKPGTKIAIFNRPMLRIIGKRHLFAQRLYWLKLFDLFVDLSTDLLSNLLETRINITLLSNMLIFARFGK